MKSGMKAYKERQRLKLLKIFIAATSVLMLAFIGSAYANEKYGTFTITLNSSYDTTAAVALKESLTEEQASDILFCDSPEEITNYCGDLIFRDQDINNVDGTHNGIAYIAYTFYALNVGEVACNLVESIVFSGEVKDVTSALRIRVYRDGVPTDYAKQAADGNKENHYCDQSFTGSAAFETESKRLLPGEYIKYTIVIWLEGDDPECLDTIRGGRVRLLMSLTVKE